MEKKKSYTCWELNPDSPARSLLLYRLTYPGFIWEQLQIKISFKGKLSAD
jgi:hypothetical protein